jgi:hypothetical protein
MSEILKQLGLFILEALKKLDWKTVLYKAYMNTVKPMLDKKVQDSASKIDDVIVNGLTQLVIKFLGPEEVPVPKLPTKPA